ncbi:hypothetical protein GOP47_0010867 [Adiantum capillus-veneris]|uniref:Uncharacterized protein n=1 Tax=Adiantum capillus-veneris TaxID=13818 RepID=A0A9D4ZJ49_ADICA|nr:hypothetical protein GOP47_0010867 [Adiantum capillus-veneris]
MSSANRKRKAVQLADAQEHLLLLQRKLARRDQLDEQIKDLRSALVTLTFNIVKAESVERELLRRDREKIESLREEIKSLVQAEGLDEVGTICSQIKEMETLIQDLSAPTYIDRVLSEGPPSSVEKEGLHKVQMRVDEPLYECCFPAVAQPPLPLSLANPLFGEFLDDFSNVSAPLDDDVCNFVAELCFSVLGRAQVFHNEAEFQFAFNRKMGGFLGHPVAVDMITCQTKKVMTDATVIAGDNWAALGELKLEKGGTLALGLQSFALHVGSLHAETELLPCFFIEVIGATIRIGGLVFFEKVAWQPLTPFMNCFYTEHDRTDMATLCRAMCALKKGLTALHSYYIEAHPSVNTITPRIFPILCRGGGVSGLATN